MTASNWWSGDAMTRRRNLSMPRSAPMLPPRSEVGVLGWLKHNLFSSPLNGLLDHRRPVADLQGRGSPDQLGRRARGLDRRRRFGLQRRERRRLLALHQGQARLVHVWPLSRCGALARQSDVPTGGRRPRRAADAAHSREGLERAVRSRAVSDHRVLPAERRHPWPTRGGNAVVGRAARDSGRRQRRHRRVVSR